MNRQMLKELIPANLIKVQNANDWKKSITISHDQERGKILLSIDDLQHSFQKDLVTIFFKFNILNSGKSEDDAKIAFLTTIYAWPTFGSAFFEVKQTTESNYPEVIIVAMNRHGVRIIHPQTKVNTFVSCLQYL